VSAEMARFRAMICEMRLAGTSSVRASSAAEMPISFSLSPNRPGPWFFQESPR
jgi:hypothetical protein